MTVTLGGLLERIERERDTTERFTFFMPGSDGPCRFGAYKNLHQLVLTRLGWSDRVRIWSPPFGDYFAGIPAGFGALVFTGIAAFGALEQAVHDVRPVERVPGSTDAVAGRWRAALERLIERAAGGDMSARRTLFEATTGRAFGIPALLRRAARELARLRSGREVPTVLLVGEIYVRSDPFANDFVARALEARGVRVRMEPVAEYIEYSDHIARKLGKKSVGDRVERFVRARLLGGVYDAVANVLGWSEHVPIPEALAAAGGYLREELEVESVLTLGVPLAAWRRREIDAVVSVGPLECMPNKIAETQFVHVGEQEGLRSLTLALNGEPIDPEVLDAFAFEVHARYAGRTHGRVTERPPAVSVLPTRRTGEEIGDRVPLGRLVAR
jgi:predicted nucleotide-binding protein (sugar kinase/HSP70/actin superfamily)